MNVHISYKGSKPPEVEQQINLNIEKLRRRLQVFRPELVHLHGNLVCKSEREGVSVSLDLRLPSGDIAVQKTGDNVSTAVKKAFDDLIENLIKHKDKLRAHHKWPNRRRSGGSRQPAPLSPQRANTGLVGGSDVPFEETLAAVSAPAVSGQDISAYVNANLARLLRFVERELRYRESNGQLRPEQVLREEVIDEAIANALADCTEKPERLGLEPWLYRLAIRAIDELATRNSEYDTDVSLEGSARRQNVTASDEPRLQFHQPDETQSQEESIADRATLTPEDIAASDEMVWLVEAALRGTKAEDREAFLLYAIEGFTAEEIAVISDKSVEQVRASVGRAREHLKKSFPARDGLKEKPMQHSKIA